MIFAQPFGFHGLEAAVEPSASDRIGHYVLNELIGFPWLILTSLSNGSKSKATDKIYVQTKPVTQNITVLFIFIQLLCETSLLQSAPDSLVGPLELSYPLFSLKSNFRRLNTQSNKKNK